MDRDDRFDELMARLRAGDEDAATAVFRRFVHRLVALAARQVDGRLRGRLDVEGVVQSAYRSFFARHGRGEFDVGGWDDLWALLVVITVRKCGRRRDALLAARRGGGREVPLGALGEAAREAEGVIDREPSPVEAAILTETVEGLLRAVGPRERPIVEHVLMGFTAEEIAARLGCSERTVFRVRSRARHCLRRLEVEAPART